MSNQPADGADELHPKYQVLAVLMMVGSISMIAYLGYLIKHEPIIAIADYIQMFMLLVIFGTLIFTIYTQFKNTENAKSADYLESSIGLINKAYDVLCDENNNVKPDRISWVTAARLLRRSTQISKNIVVSSHRDIYVSEKDFQRHRFNDLLQLDGDYLPIEFFFGNGYLKHDVGASACRTTNNGLAEWIPPRIVSEVYRFNSFPLDYDDPLEESMEYSEADIQKEVVLFEQDGVCGYLRFRRHFMPISKKVFHIQSNGTKEVSPLEINELLPQVLLSSPLSPDEI